MSDLGARVSSPAPFGASRNAAGDSRAPSALGGPRPRGWHKRGYLPHYDVGHRYQCITYRLADALPADVVQRLASEPLTPAGNTAYRDRIEGFLDSGHGACWLRRREIASLVLNAWRYFDGERYELVAWAIMPNHVHVMIHVREMSLSEIVKGWKSVTARQINRILGRSGRVWQEDYWDRYIRDEKHFSAAVQYIHENPVKAGLVGCAEDWPWSSGARVSSPALSSEESGGG